MIKVVAIFIPNLFSDGNGSSPYKIRRKIIDIKIEKICRHL